MELVESKLPMKRINCVIESVHQGKDVWVTVRLESGRPDGGSRLVCFETGDVYKIENLVLIGWQAMAAGYRAFFLSSVDPLRQTSPLSPGMHLVSEE